MNVHVRPDGAAAAGVAKPQVTVLGAGPAGVGASLMLANAGKAEVLTLE